MNIAGAPIAHEDHVDRDLDQLDGVPHWTLTSSGRQPTRQDYVDSDQLDAGD